MSASDEYLFEDDAPESAAAAGKTASDAKRWKVLIADDDEQIHRVTKFALKNFSFGGQELELDHAYSGKETCDKVSQTEYGVIFLDVVMESDHAGLDVVNYIRKKLNNTRSRIILRTGQPGMAPEKMVVQEYDIDDYRAKADLSADKLYTSLTTSLRNYAERLRIDAIIEERTREVMQMNTQILESIRYAERIQSALLPSVEYFRKYIPNLGIFYRAKDIVSGDFFFFSKKEDRIVFANVDCTGHGVPGAIMSIFAYNLLSLIVNFLNEKSCETILSELDEKLNQLLSQEGKKDEINDGMDMSLVTIYPEKMQLHFAGANHTLLILRDGELLTYEGDRVPIGAWIQSKKTFNTYVIELQPNDRIYQYTDGIVDQFGGPEGRKFSVKRLKQLLLDTSNFDVQAQINKVEIAFDEWKQLYNQTDDVSLIAFEAKFN